MRNWFLDIVAGCLMNLALAICIVQLGDLKPAVLSTLWVFLAILAIEFACSIWSGTRFWILYWLFTKKRMARFYLADLNKNDMPSTKASFDGTSYLNEVVENSNAPIPQRIRAAFHLGEISAARVTHPMTLCMAMQFGLDAAMSRYDKPIQHEDQAKVDQAFNLGRNVAGEMASAAEAHIKARTQTIRPAFLKVLSDQIKFAAVQTDHSPILMARAEYDAFIEHVATSKVKLAQETYETLAEWHDLIESLDEVPRINKLISKVIDDAFLPLITDGLQVMADNSDRLKEADDRWRELYPDNAAEEPLDR